MRILGISSFYHDSAAVLLVDGEVIAAAQEERFTRRKHEPRFPEHAIRYCLAAAGLDLDAMDYIAFYEKPLLKFARLLSSYLANAPRGYALFKESLPIWVTKKLFQKRFMARSLAVLSQTRRNPTEKMLFARHHQSHAASAFYPSPFDEAIVLTLDGVGEWATASVAIGRGNRLDMLKEMRWPHSLGMLYSAFTHHAGFRVNSGEYKLMGLAPYGEPRYVDLILEYLIDLKDDGSFWIDQSYFNYADGLAMTSKKFDALFGGSARAPGAPLTQREMDIAASIQEVTNTVLLRLTRDLAATYGVPNLCMAGGVALNCVANGKVVRDGHFKQVWIQPAAGDAGGALGAAYIAHCMHAGQPRRRGLAIDEMKGVFLGPEFPQSEIEARLVRSGAHFTVLTNEAMILSTVEALVAGHAVGWFQGRMEFGPRALGARSILGDPRQPDMQRNLNLKIKYRESFRPFAPAVLAEDAQDYFELGVPSPYMLVIADVVERRRCGMSPQEERYFGIEKLNVARSEIPAVTHVDYSARVQTVHRETNPRFHTLISAFKARTGCPVLVNTSFNVRGEPIVNTPEDAFRCFMGCEMDTLVIGNCLLSKNDQNPRLISDNRNKFAPD
jgi:carbamoyltransferase